MAAAAAATASSDSASPQCEDISGLHLIRNRTLRPLALAASQPFHFMSPIPCSDFIYLHGDSNKIKKGATRGPFYLGFFTAHSLTISYFQSEKVDHNCSLFDIYHSLLPFLF